MWVEISFNLAYLAVVWSLVIAMWHRRPLVAPEDRRVASLFLGAFALLALGDTGHVGFRVLAYALGGLESKLTLVGMQLGLVGLGALATAVTVTFFYVLMVAAWQARFDKSYGWFGYLLLVATAVRLLLMLPAANEWNNVVPPQPWSLYRNLPLMLQGLGVAFLFLRDAQATGDRPFTWVGAMVLVSYACYIPVILFVQRLPIIGMLMIPKTVAYVAIAVLVYRNLYAGVPAPRMDAPLPNS
jgi:hypothetical protein